MADTVVSSTQFDTPYEIAVSYRVTSDGTGQADAIVIDKSAIAVAATGAEAASLDIEEVIWNASGYSADVLLEWDHTTDDVAFRLPKSGSFYWSAQSASRTQSGSAARQDPRSTGGTGDLVITTTGVSGAWYDLTIKCRKAHV